MKRMTETEAKAYATKWVKEKVRGTSFKGEAGEPWKLLHHEILLEYTTEPVVNRVEYVLLHKPLEEIEVRLAEMEPWVWEIPERLAKARDAYSKALDAYDKALDAYSKARDAYSKAWGAYDKARDAYNKARDAYNKARDAYNKAWDAYNKAWDAATPELNKTIQRERPNSKWNGKKIEGTA